MARNLLRFAIRLSQPSLVIRSNSYCLITKMKVPLTTFCPSRGSRSIVQKSAPLSVCVRMIHVTPQRKALPPILLLILRPLMNIMAIIFGRSIRKWWAKLSDEEREEFKSKVRAQQSTIAFTVTFLFGSLLLYYVEHITQDPITKRKRFIIYNDKQMRTIAQLEFERQILEFRPHLVPVSHPLYQRAARVANRLILANKDLQNVKNKEWAVTVVDKPDVTNAFVLPHGKIFVFTGMMNVCTNDDQLAIVLSHEIAHSVLSHVAENLSKVFMFEMIFLIPLIAIWAVFSDVGALFTQWLAGELAQIMIHLPFSRAIEMEADMVGLFLAARACFDIREAPVFWAKMSQINSPAAPVEWLSTHPSHTTRQRELTEMLPGALKVREHSDCPMLLPRMSQILLNTPSGKPRAG